MATNSLPLRSQLPKLSPEQAPDERRIPGAHHDVIGFDLSGAFQCRGRHVLTLKDDAPSGNSFASSSAYALIAVKQLAGQHDCPGGR